MTPEEIYRRKYNAWKSNHNRKPSNQPPLRDRWVTVMGPDSLALLERLRAAHRRRGGRQPFLVSANGILRRVSNLPNNARRRDYVKGCIRKMLNSKPDKPVPAGPLFPKLEQRVGKAMAREFFNKFFNIPIFRPGSSGDKITEQFDAIAVAALGMSHSGAFLRKLIRDAKRDRNGKR